MSRCQHGARQYPAYRLSHRNVLLFPLVAGGDLSFSALREVIDVRSLVLRPFLNQPFTDKFVEIRVQTTVVHFGFVVLFELFFDSESVWVVQAGCHDQQIALETCQVMYES